ncbi:CHAP domain-containing protein [Rhizobium sp. KVB221]|uniref:CHAP domain-containing protein n=1 Tax=Rhizobium setariae TaxID=2801340 RepID=A0A937CM64_9HYPH|nr:peptidoglycan-binding protein [Rhizobium setariae]MBL0372411.1 CHAP domain-containing protein [Rhizobium setariae]
MVEYTDALEKEYNKLIATARLRPEKLAQIDGVLRRIFLDENWQRYQEVAERTGIPAHVIAIIHSLEAGGRFDCHLHNGDPLTAKTRNVPRNRPRTGSPPFSWVASAIDALEEVSEGDDWSLSRTAYVFERFNGFGYRSHHPHAKSPYLWSFTNIYASGKYTSDGRWSETAVSRQCGAMALLLRMIQKELIPAAVPQSTDEDEPPGRPLPPVPAPRYPGRMLRRDSHGPNVTRIQERLKILGIQEVGPVDADFGERTEWAVKLFQARHEDGQGEPLEIDGVVGPMTWNSLFEIEPAGSGETEVSVADNDLASAALDIAANQIGVLEQPRGSNRGPMVDEYMNAVDGGLRGQPWCMAFVYWCFRQAAQQNGLPLRVPKTASVWRSWEMAQAAGQGEILTAREARADPDRVRPGMVFYIDTGGRNGHTGFVRDIIDGKLVTIEGNTNNDGSREGYGVFQRSRRRIDSINLGFIAYD